MKKINQLLITNVIYALLLITILIGLSAILFWRLSATPQKDVVDAQTFQVGELLNHFDTASADWVALSNSLIPYGYNLLVSADNHMVYSNLENNQYRTLERFQKLNLAETTLIGQLDNIAYVIKPSDTCIFFALKNMIHTNETNTFLIAFLVFSIVTIALILPTSVIYTRKISRSLRAPIKALTVAAKKMADSNLAEPMPYLENGSYTTITNILNQMRETVLIAQNTSASYEEAHTDIISGISQDLRAPLTAVKNYLKHLTDGTASTAEITAQYLSAAYTKVCDMDTLLQKLFYLSNMETGNLQMIPSSQDFGVFLRRFFEDMRDDFKKNQIQLSLEITPTFHPVKIDQVQMRRVFVNLTENAIKYTDTKPLQLLVSLKVTNGQEYLKFADNGPGIPENELPHIYEQFWRSEKARTNMAGEGSGLGLYFVKYIIEAHDGSISAQNNNGLQFQITLPQSDEDFFS
jgi:signal transduction histidine kinase